MSEELARAVAQHWENEYRRLAAVIRRHGIDVCACDEGPYYGAQAAGSPTKCERCRRLT